MSENYYQWNGYNNSLKTSFIERTDIENLFFCSLSGIYVNLVYCCDSYPNCPDGEDESNCSTPIYIQSSTNEQLNIKTFCDFIQDSELGDDEKGCSEKL